MFVDKSAPFGCQDSVRSTARALGYLSCQRGVEFWDEVRVVGWRILIHYDFLFICLFVIGDPK